MPQHVLSEIMPHSYEDSSYLAPVVCEMGGMQPEIMEQGNSQMAL
jgi:hypothetical protein